jgi:hypothetical protein
MADGALAIAPTANPDAAAAIADLAARLATAEAALADAERRMAERDTEMQRVRDAAEREVVGAQAATREILESIKASPGELGPVCALILERAIVLGDAAFGLVCRYEGDGSFPPACWRGDLSDAAIAWLQRWVVARSGGPLLRIERGDPCVHIEDVAAEHAYQAYKSAATHSPPFVELAVGAPACGCRCAAATDCWVASSPPAARCGCSPTKRSGCCKASPRRPLSPWRTRG